MTQIHQIAILFPLAVSAGAVVCTIFVHALALGATVNFVRHERLVGKQKLARTLDKRSELGIISLGAVTKTRYYLGSPIAASVPLQTVAGSCEFHSRRREPDGV